MNRDFDSSIRTLESFLDDELFLHHSFVSTSHVKQMFRRLSYKNRSLDNYTLSCDLKLSDFFLIIQVIISKDFINYSEVYTPTTLTKNARDTLQLVLLSQM